MDALDGLQGVTLPAAMRAAQIKMFTVKKTSQFWWVKGSLSQHFSGSLSPLFRGRLANFFVGRFAHEELSSDQHVGCVRIRFGNMGPS